MYMFKFITSKLTLSWLVCLWFGRENVTRQTVRFNVQTTNYKVIGNGYGMVTYFAS